MPAAKVGYIYKRVDVFPPFNSNFGRLLTCSLGFAPPGNICEFTSIIARLQRTLLQYAYSGVVLILALTRHSRSMHLIEMQAIKEISRQIESDSVNLATRNYDLVCLPLQMQHL